MHTAATRDVTLDLATQAESALIANLLQLYIHDLSEVFQVEIGADGRFDYPNLPLYWSERDRRFPFLIRSGDRVVGFALITRGSPITDDPDNLDIAECFVLRRYRRSGIARQAATQLWNRMPGHWIVRVSQGNHSGVAFWRSAIHEYTGGRLSESTWPGNPHDWRVYSFDSVGPKATP